MSDDPYCRLYWRFADEFPDVWEDDHALALYGRLLRLAEMAWPSAATLPYGVRRSALAMLTQDREGGPLVGMVTAITYRIRGMGKEREKRANHASRAARTRWSNAASNAPGNAPSIAAGNAQSMPSQAKPRQAETSTDTARASDPVVIYANRVGGFPSPKAMNWLDQLTEQYGSGAVISAIGKAKGQPGGLIGEVQNILRAEARELSVKEKATEKAKVAERRVDGMLARRLEWFANTGQWPEEWGERPAA